MKTIQKITNADCDGGGEVYVVCEDNDINQAYEQFDTLAEAEALSKKMELHEGKFVIVYSSSFVPCGVKLIGNPEDCTPEYPDTVELFESHAAALAYIKRYEPTLDESNIAPASSWL